MARDRVAVKVNVIGQTAEIVHIGILRLVVVNRILSRSGVQAHRVVLVHHRAVQVAPLVVARQARVHPVPPQVVQAAAQAGIVNRRNVSMRKESAVMNVRQGVMREDA